MRGLGKRFRFWLRLLAAFGQKHGKLIVGGLITGVLVFLYFPKFLNSFLPKNTQKIGLVGRFTAAELPLEVQHLISDGLTRILPNGEAIPSLASSWEVNQEGREYLFILRDDIYWQNDKPVLAKEINYNFTDVAPLVVEEKKIKFQLKEPFTPFPTVVARPVFKKGFLGTGEYKVQSVKRNGQIVESLILIPLKDKSNSTLVFRFYLTESAAKTAFKLGEVNFLEEIGQPGELENWEKVKVTAEVKYNRFAGLFFDTQNPKFQDKFVRQALAYAIHKRWEPRAFNPINPHSWAYNANVKPYNFDQENAQRLLKKATEENETPFLEELELATIPSLLSVAEAIKADWEQIGLKVKIKIINSLEEPFEVLLVAQEVPPDPDQYVLWHSTQTANISHYKSPKLDKLLEDGRKTLDKEKRKEIYDDFQRFLVEDTPVIFLYHPTVYTIERK